MTGAVLGLWVLLANLLAFAAFGLDKARARAGARRVPESTLLLIAALGGWIGAKAGQRVFRHKTVKQPFATLLNLTLAIPLLALLVV
jgi:uncharacterized membrane protein YsdA (DUF1294 family)